MYERNRKKDVPPHFTPSVWSILRDRLDQSIVDGTTDSYKLSTEVCHIRQGPPLGEEWACGWQSIRMIITAMLQGPYAALYSKSFSKKCLGSDIGIRRLQGLAEEVWEDGFDANSRDLYSGQILGTEEPATAGIACGIFSFLGVE